MANDETKACTLHRHKQFHNNGICLVCNPDAIPQALRDIVIKPWQREYYQALLDGKECHVLNCERLGAHFDQLPDGHWWCQKHVYHCLYLQEGAARNFPAWECMVGITILAGRPNWYKSAMHASVEDMQNRVAKLRGISVEELCTQVESQPAEEAELYWAEIERAEAAQKLRRMMETESVDEPKVEEDELDLSAIPF